MLIHYISPSILPSRSANAVHVLKQCDALARYSDEVRCYARRSLFPAVTTESYIIQQYGITSQNIKLYTHFLPTNRAVSFCIAFQAILYLIFSPRAHVLSRNLYASYFLGVVLSRRIIFETHQLEIGIGRFMQKLLIRQKHVTTIVISHKLKEIMEDYHQTFIANPLVLHDAASVDIQSFCTQAYRNILSNKYGIIKSNWRSICGYFGHLYPGRGIEVITEMAAQSPEDLFLVVGGTDPDIHRLSAHYLHIPNIRFLGFVPHTEAQSLMKTVDILLMPYQRSVSIGVQGHDTARWMSPMKMFEYMACGKPIIASNLEVLREVLVDGFNALLVSPDDIQQWITALNFLNSNQSLSSRIGRQAYSDFTSQYTWDKRAQAIIAQFK